MTSEELAILIEDQFSRVCTPDQVAILFNHIHIADIPVTQPTYYDDVYDAVIERIPSNYRKFFSLSRPKFDELIEQLVSMY